MKKQHLIFPTILLIIIILGSIFYIRKNNSNSSLLIAKARCSQDGEAFIKTKYNTDLITISNKWFTYSEELNTCLVDVSVQTIMGNEKIIYDIYSNKGLSFYSVNKDGSTTGDFHNFVTTENKYFQGFNY